MRVLTKEQRERMGTLREKGFSNLTKEEREELRGLRRLIIESAEGKAKVPAAHPVKKGKKVVKEADEDAADDDDEEEEEEEGEAEEEEVETLDGADDNIVVPDELDSAAPAETPSAEAGSSGAMVEMPAVVISTIKVPASLVADLEKDGMSSEMAQQTAESYKRTVAEHVNQIVKKMNRKARLAVLENKITNRRLVANRARSIVDYHAAKWAKENRIAIEQGTKAMVLESLMTGMKRLLEEHNIDIPRGKESLIDKMQRQLDEATEKSSALIKENIQLQKQARRLVVEQQVESICRELTDNQKTRIRRLALESRWSDVAALKTNITEIKAVVTNSDTSADTSKKGKTTTLESTMIDEALTAQPSKKTEEPGSGDSGSEPNKALNDSITRMLSGGM